MGWLSWKFRQFVGEMMYSTHFFWNKERSLTLDKYAGTYLEFRNSPHLSMNIEYDGSIDCLQTETTWLGEKRDKETICLDDSEWFLRWDGVLVQEKSVENLFGIKQNCAQEWILLKNGNLMRKQIEAYEFKGLLGGYWFASDINYQLWRFPINPKKTE